MTNSDRLPFPTRLRYSVLEITASVWGGSCARVFAQVTDCKATAMPTNRPCDWLSFSALTSPYQARMKYCPMVACRVYVWTSIWCFTMLINPFNCRVFSFIARCWVLPCSTYRRTSAVVSSDTTTADSLLLTVPLNFYICALFSIQYEMATLVVTGRHFLQFIITIYSMTRWLFMFYCPPRVHVSLELY